MRLLRLRFKNACTSVPTRTLVRSSAYRPIKYGCSSGHPCLLRGRKRVPFKAPAVRYAWLALVFGCTLRASAGPDVVPIWPKGAPDALSAPGYVEELAYWNDDKGWPLAKKVSVPTLEVHRPSGVAVPTALLIFPGGGYTSVNLQKEGRDVADWLNGLGITAVVVKYRLPSDAIMKDRSVGPLQDAQEAIRFVRRHAKEWGIRSNHIGVVGFSSGGHLAASAATLYREKTYTADDAVSARPDFAILIYPVISMRPEITPRSLTHDLLGESPTAALIQKFSLELHVASETPPAFIVHAKDDQAVSVENSLCFERALRTAGVPVELHLYEKGNHGFGLGLFPDSPKTWPDELKQWLGRRGLLKDE